MNLIEAYNIKIIKEQQDEVIIEMPVLDIHKQPFGMVHGGVYGVLIETAASLGGMSHVPSGDYVVGIDLQVNHLKGVSEGILTTIAIPNHIGKTTQVWEATIYDEEKRKIAVGRCSLLNRKH
ncbi:PaaI family thioesterase [Vagococcus fluvialis]|uniref:PaaI family thioesterase n=1 Tax=Vagococcus fluvialis TaxID=2738 RepID=UPI001A902673|nr:PaaI family thioesterase [Vagococcus fluvialis]MBO0436857.1 PaaI family thioesterase [Vagococcus fluvialis]